MNKDVLDIGAGDNPSPEATVAVDIYPPTDIPNNINVVKTKSAKETLGIPIKIKRDNKLKTYIIGDARKILPTLKEKSFDEVLSEAAVGIDSPINTIKVYEEINRILKPDGEVKIDANPGPKSPKDWGLKGRKRVVLITNHIKDIGSKMIEAGLEDVTVDCDLTQSLTVFRAKKGKPQKHKAKHRVNNMAVMGGTRK